MEIISNRIPGYQDDIGQLNNIASWIRRSLTKYSMVGDPLYSPLRLFSFAFLAHWGIGNSKGKIGSKEGLYYLSMWGMSMDIPARIPLALNGGSPYSKGWLHCYEK